MGEIAEMLLDGILDEWTGEYIGPGVGYPRSMDPQHPSNQYRKNKKHSPNYGKDPMTGINNWVAGKVLPGLGKDTAYETRAQRLIRRYATEVLNMPDAKYKAIAKEISTNHWVPFITWAKQTYKYNH